MAKDPGFRSLSPTPSEAPRLPQPSRTGETDVERAVRIATETRRRQEDLMDEHAELKASIQAVKSTLGEPPNPVLNFPGSGLHLPIAQMLKLTEAQMEAQMKRDEWIKWAVRVIGAALLVAAVGGSVTWAMGLHH